MLIKIKIGKKNIIILKGVGFSSSAAAPLLKYMLFL
jgi:hypothetical protein